MFKKTKNLVFIFILLFHACSPDEIMDSTGIISYHQDNRPQLHYSPPANWMGVPMSSIFFEEEYHFFYQYRDDVQSTGPLHWGHAVSTDLIHWEELELALSPDENGEILPGSVFIDWDNISELSTDGEPPLIAAFSYPSDNKTPAFGMAYSTDQGRKWSKLSEKLLLPNPTQLPLGEPKIFWDTDSRKWLMLVSTPNSVLFYSSLDLKNWRYLSEFGKNVGAHGGHWKCPEIFPMLLPETGDKKWILLISMENNTPNGGSGVQYFVGEFDGKKFRLGQEFAPFIRRKNNGIDAVWLDYGRDFYAGVSWSNLDEDRGQCVITGWMNNIDYSKDLPTSPWKGAMAFPRILELHSTAIGPRIFQSFPEELKSLRKQAITTDILGVFENKKTLDCSPQQLEIIFEAGVVQDSSTIVGFELSNSDGETYTVGFDAKENHYFSDRTKCGENSFYNNFGKNLHIAPKQSDGSLISMHILIDATSCELIADDGLTVLSEQFFPSEPFNKIDFYVNGLSIDVQRLDVFELEKIWE